MGSRRTVSVAAAAAVLILAACGKSLSAEDYYGQAEAAAAAYDGETDAIFDGYRETVAEALADFQERTADADTETLVEETARLLDITVTEVTAAFEKAQAALEAFVAEMEDLDPPPEIETEHEEVLAALQRSLDSIPELLDALLETDSLADISATINASSFGDTQPRLVAACRELESAAGELGIDADLRCGGSDDGDASG